MTKHRYAIINVAEAIERGILQPEYERPTFRDALFDVRAEPPRLVWLEPIDISGTLQADLGPLVEELNTIDAALWAARSVAARAAKSAYDAVNTARRA